MEVGTVVTISAQEAVTHFDEEQDLFER